MHAVRVACEALPTVSKADSERSTADQAHLGFWLYKLAHVLPPASPLPQLMSTLQPPLMLLHIQHLHSTRATYPCIVFMADITDFLEQFAYFLYSCICPLPFTFFEPICGSMYIKKVNINWLSVIYSNHILLFYYEANLAIHCQILITDCWYPLKSVHIVDFGNICLNRWGLHLAWDEPLGVRPDVYIWQPLSYCLRSTWCIFLCDHECGLCVSICAWTELNVCTPVHVSV